MDEGRGEDPIVLQVDPEGTNEARLSVVSQDGWFSAAVRFDGCIDYRQYANTPYRKDEARDEPCDDYVHVCDLDVFIERLQAIKAEAVKHFGTWPE